MNHFTYESIVNDFFFYIPEPKGILESKIYLRNKPSRAMTRMGILPELITIALGGVATGNIKAKLALMVAGTLPDGVCNPVRTFNTISCRRN
ncbi:MAG: hypothetical protein ABFS56_14750 [Pseudomonadota bacterium]